MNSDKEKLYNDSIAKSDNETAILSGIMPRHMTAYAVYKKLLFLTIGLIFIFALLMGLRRYVFQEIIVQFVFYQIYFSIVAIIAALTILIRLVFLRRAPFDDWVLKVANSRLGTTVVFYDSRKIYIDYDRTRKEQEKRDFVIEMTDKSNYYSYFLTDTLIDDGYLEIECIRKTELPKSCVLDVKDDKLWNAFPLGVVRNDATQSITPIDWYLNDQHRANDHYNAIPSVSILITGGTGSGKSVAEQNIVGHVSRYADKFMLAGVDCKKVEFSLLPGVKGVVGVALDVISAQNLISRFQKTMVARNEFMSKQKVNNVYKIQAEVDYYEMNGQKYQFDEMFELTVDLLEEDYNARQYNKLATAYPNLRIPIIMTIEEIYNALQEGKYKNPQIPERKGMNGYLKKGDIKKTKGEFVVKTMILLCDELNELMDSEDYQAVENIKTNLGSIARLGRAAGVHLALAAQFAGSGTINKDLSNNINMRLLLGGFDATVSGVMFDKDISDMAKPQIKGRGFIQAGTGAEINEVQTYYTSQEDGWVFDEELKATYENPIYIEQCKRRGITPQNTGWVAQHPVDVDQSEVDELDVDDLLEEDLLEDEPEIKEPTKEESVIEEPKPIIGQKPKIKFEPNRGSDGKVRIKF